MTRQVTFGLAILATLVASAQAAPIIEGGIHYLQPGESARLAVTVSGGDVLPAVEFFVQIGDGGPENGGTDVAPVITVLDIVGPGTIFHGKDSGSNPENLGPLMFYDSVTTDVGKTVTADGTLAYVTVDTTGAAAGSYAFRLQGVYTLGWPPNALNPTGGLHTGFTDFGPTPVIHDGLIVVVPEPSAFVLLAAGVPALALWMRWKRRLGQS